MTKETIYNPDTQREIIQPGDKRPRFTHFTVERSDPLWVSKNPIIRSLIEAGWEIRTTYSEFFEAFPQGSLRFSGHFVFQERHEFEIRVPEGCWLRFRWEGPDSVYLTLFYVEYARQGRGLGKIWFPRITDALFRAGVKYMRGAVSPAFYPARWKMNVPRLTQFYIREGFSTDGDGYIWKCSPYEDLDDSDDVSEAATVLQS